MAEFQNERLAREREHQRKRRVAESSEERAQ